MDCQKAETAMMHYMEKTLKPADARDLAKHVLRCVPCRELYLTLDEAAEMLAAPPEPAPDGFTERVMARVRELPAHAATAGNTVLRILWGLSAIMMGVVLMFTLNPHWAETLTWVSQAAEAVRSALYAVAGFFGRAGEWLAQPEGSQLLMSSGLGIAALVFAIIILALLYGLHRGENTPQKSIQA